MTMINRVVIPKTIKIWSIDMLHAQRLNRMQEKMEI